MNDIFYFASIFYREVSLTQMAYRLFKIISLPSLLPDLVHRWLTQRLVEYTAETAVNCNMLETVKWLANVHQCLQKSFFKIELEHELPGKNDIFQVTCAPIRPLF